MSIFERTGQASQLGGPSTSLDLFANRHDLTKEFLARVHQPPKPGRVLFLYGMGGNGKSSLLRYLQLRCCVRFDPDDWNALTTEPYPDVLARLSAAERGTRIPNASIDFGAQPVGQQRPLEALPGLFILKKQLTAYGIRTPRFDFAAVNYLQKSGLAYKQILPEFFPDAELELVKQIADALAGLPVIGAGRALVDVFNSRTNHMVKRWRMTRRIEGDVVAEILEAPAYPVLADRLPVYFAMDLNAAVDDGNSPIALFCDTHEAFWGEDAFPMANAVSLAALTRDRWLRTLLGHLNLEAGIVVVVAGRKPPRWSSAAEDRIPDDYIELRHVVGLRPDDAKWFLDRVGIDKPELQQLIIQYASAVPDEVHPYMLGLCTDVMLAHPLGRDDPAAGMPQLKADLEARRRWLVARLMSSVTEEMQRRVVAVAACRSFDLEAFSFLGSRLGFSHSVDDFRRLVTFSFVLELTTDPRVETFRVHDLLRRELSEMFASQIADAHTAMVEYYSDRPEPAARAEAALHLSRLNRADGMQRWCEAIDKYLATGRYAESQAFLGVVHDMTQGSIPPSTEVIYRIAQTYIGLGAIAEAQALLEQISPDSVEAVLLRADLEFCECAFTAAEATARAGLNKATGNGRTRLQLRLAEILLYRGDFKTARRVLAFSDGDVPGPLARRMLLGEVAFFSGHVEEAQHLFQGCSQELEQLPEAERDATSVGWVLAGLGLVHLFRKEWSEAFDAYERGLHAREEASHARGAANSLLGKGQACSGAGRHREARTYLARAGTLALGQGDAVTLAKIRHADAVSHLATGEVTSALELLEDSLDSAKTSCVPYDICHCLIDLSLARQAARDDRGMVEALTEARRRLIGSDFGLLTRSYPDLTEPPVAKIRSGLLAFAVGDAVGVPWEGARPEEITIARGECIGTREDWPVGSTSDDTSQLLATVRALTTQGQESPPEMLLRLLAEQMPQMRGVGPTTPRAVARFLETGKTIAEGGTTNGAIVRSLAVGWAFPATDTDARRRMSDAMAATTHNSAEALVSARVVAALASWAVEGVRPETLGQVAAEELETALATHELSPMRQELIFSACSGSWSPPAEGVSPEALETLAATLTIIQASLDPAEAIVMSVRLGGDTDSVAALVAGILGCGVSASAESLPWVAEVQLATSEKLERLAAELASLRYDRYK